MLGAIIGDTIGSAYEGIKVESKDFELFTPYTHPTDDSIMTIAVMKTILENYPLKKDEISLIKLENDTINNFVKLYELYPHAGYGIHFEMWCSGEIERKPYNSYGNGSAMRISPVGWVSNSVEEVKLYSNIISKVTHNHIEGLKGAEAIAMCIYFARQNKSKEYIKKYVIDNYYPKLKNLTYKDLFNNYETAVSCQNTVPEAICCFLDSTDFEDCLRNAVSIGGDTDTIAAMSCSIAEAYYKDIPPYLCDIVFDYLDDYEQEIVNEFNELIDNN